MEGGQKTEEGKWVGREVVDRREGVKCQLGRRKRETDVGRLEGRRGGMSKSGANKEKM